MKHFPLYALTLVLGVPLLAAPAKKPATKPAAKPAAKPKPKVTPHPTPKPTPKAVPRAVEAPKPEPTPIAEVGPKTWAVLVGVSQYQSSQISGLHYPAKDASGLRDALVDPKVGGIPAKQVLLLTDADATRAKILGAVDSFLAPNVQDGDKVLIFLAGHGIAKSAGADSKSYLLPTDVKGLTIPALDNTAVPLNILSEKLADLPASQFVIFVDACREDPTPGRGLTPNGMSNVLARGITVNPKKADAQSATLFACSLGQRAYEDEKYGHGVFTKWIIDGLRVGDTVQNNGNVDLARLTTYTKDGITEWAKVASQSGNFEIDQVPDLVPGKQMLLPILLTTKRKPSDNLIPVPAPRLAISSVDGAQISIDGTRVGVGTAEKDRLTEGDHTVSITKVGYAPVSRSVKAISGYENQVVIDQLQPAGTAPVSTGGTTPSATATDLYKKALDAQSRQQWEVAEQGFTAAIQADPKYTAAYEASYDLHVLQNRNTNALVDALGLFGASPKSAHSYAFLSRAYSQFATKGTGNSGPTRVQTVGDFGAPKDIQDASKQARNAAKEAVKLEPSSPEAQLALGYAMSALDIESKRKDDAIAAFGKAALADPTNAANQVGYGYGIRYYATLPKAQGNPQSELNRAVTTLNQAVTLRPDYYDAHRELAFCYMALENTDEALKECGLARATRGDAGDVNEIAAIEVALSGLHKKVAETATGDVKEANEQASQGYIEEAQETSKDKTLKFATSILNLAGVSSSLRSYLPAQLLPLLDIRGTINNKVDEMKNDAANKVKNKMPKNMKDKIKLPF